MNKTIASLCLIATASVNAHALSTIAQADSAYMNDDFALAAQLYEQANDELGTSAERYFNTGNAYYKAGRPGKAIVNYERALRLDPSNKDIAENLQFVNDRIEDKMETPSFVNDKMDSLNNSISSNAWAWTGFALFLLTLAGVGCYFFASSVPLRKIGFFGAGITLLLCIGVCIMAWRSMSRATANDDAIVISPSVQLSTKPRTPKDRTEEAFRLHEGAKVKVIKSLSTDYGTWYEVTFNDENRAWLPGSDIEII